MGSHQFTSERLFHHFEMWNQKCVVRLVLSVFLPVENSGFFEDVSQIDVGVQEIGVQCHSFLEMVNGQPNLALSIEDATKVAPSHRKVWPGLDGSQVAGLIVFRKVGKEYKGVKGGKSREEKKYELVSAWRYLTCRGVLGGSLRYACYRTDFV